MKKRIIAFLLAAVMMLALSACTGNGSSSTATSDPLTKDDVVSMTVMSSASWPHRDDWKIWEYIEEGTGATLEVTAIPASDYETKMTLMFASPELLTDLIGFEIWGTDKYIKQGGLIAFDDVEEYMPNYKKWADSLTDEQYDFAVGQKINADGKVYLSPCTGREGTRGNRTWLYRKDIFDKHGLAVPTTYDELYEVAKKLKELYPDSYPFGLRSGIGNMGVTGSEWKAYWEPYLYYDFNAEKWSWGAAEDTMLDVITFYKKMVDEGLTTPDFMTINIQSWQELVTTNRAFIFPDFETRIDFFNSLAGDENPDFNLAAMAPPIANPELGVAKVGRYDFESICIAIANTLDNGRIANAAKFLDCFYTDKMIELVSWGKEGETYEVVDGKKQFITDGKNQVNTLYGFTLNGTFTCLDPEAVAATESDSIRESRELVVSNIIENINPWNYLTLNEEEAKVNEEAFAACQVYTDEIISKMILGQLPLSEFDKVPETLRELGSEELIAAFTSAYDRVK